MKTDQYIIAIGASAGGMNQINTFFDFTPLDGVSYIVIQHLSSDYKSIMSLLLARHSKLNIVEAENNMDVEENKVYLIPSKNVMTIHSGRLLLTDKHKGVNLTIDTFFESLAAERGDKTIGIILSGTGSDGTIGMKAIKKAGGLLIASDPELSEFGQMPASAIATGMVDFVVSPDRMPKVIQQFVNKELHQRVTKVNVEEDEKILLKIIELIKNKLPEDFSNYKKPTILRRVKRRASLHNFDNLESYFNLLRVNVEELQSLAKDFLISVTSFFRDKDAFLVLEKNIFPEIIAAKKEEDLKIWVAGCATGEEAYSIAILVHEQLTVANKSNTVKIFATDIDNNALELAGKGFYSKSIDKDVSPERLETFFSKTNNGYKIKPVIREMLIFAHHDITKNPPYCNMDFISCRNLLIYINKQLQKRILSMLHFGLKYQGYLFLGPSESVMDITQYVKEIDKRWKIYKNNESKKQINFESFLPPFKLTSKAKEKLYQKNNNLQMTIQQSFQNFNQNILIELGYAGAWIDENSNVLYVFGETDKYLLPKLFIHHLPDLLPRPLAIAFSTATTAADSTKKLTAVKGINIENGNSSVVLSVRPLLCGDDGAKRLVLFSDDTDSPAKKTMNFDENFYRNTYTSGIEAELKATREKLIFANELLDASNENIQSFNEELFSANEEMQSTNEEMQSVNEELQSINAEYQAKIKELSDLNDDLNNYFRSNVNGQVFVNNDLLLLKFSPGAASHINFIETDIGRPLSNISTNIRLETIDADIKEVLVKGNVITKEIQAINGKWFQVMTMPYIRKEKNIIDGAIITFNDISDLKEVQQKLAASNRSLQAINADLDNFVYTASHDFLGPVTNIEQIIYLLKEKEKALDNETNEYIDMLSGSIKNFKNVIREMAEIGKMESELLKQEVIDLEEMIDSIVQSIQWKISFENAQVQTLLTAKKIIFSKKNCRSILFNLINNALKFRASDRYPKIIITTTELPDYILISVKDNGIGIDKDKLESVFRMYHRLNNNIEGQGLGLFLINKFIDASGGKVEVESEPGAGTEFKLFIKK